MCPLQTDVWWVLPLLRLLKLHDLVFNERRWCDWEQDGWSHFLHKCIAAGRKRWRESGKSLMPLHLLLFCFISFLNKDIGGNTQGAGWGWNQLDQTGSCYREGGEVRQEEEEEEDVGRVKRRRGRWDKVEQRIWRELRVEDGRREAGAEEKWGLSVLDMSVDGWSERQTAKGPIPPVM